MEAFSALNVCIVWHVYENVCVCVCVYGWTHCLVGSLV